jgi:dTMP kinase
VIARYVAIEGIEGVGKSTVAGRVSAAVRAGGAEVVAVREPGGTSAGERIRDILLDPGAELSPWTEALLFAAARAQLASDVVGPALQAGGWVISDRSVYSSLAYQGGGRNLGVAAVRALNEPGLGDVWPHLVVILDVEPRIGLERQHVADRIGAESVEFQQRVAETFRALARAEPDRFVTVDASQPVDDVVRRVIEAMEAHW